MHWKGPFEVLERINGNDCKIQLPNKTRMFHANLLKKYFKWTVGDHVDVLHDFFDRVRRASLTLRPSKCEIGQCSIKFLEHHVGEKGMQSSSDLVKKILDAPRPEDKKELRSFLWLVGYYRKFVPNFAACTARWQSWHRNLTLTHWMTFGGKPRSWLLEAWSSMWCVHHCWAHPTSCRALFYRRMFQIKGWDNLTAGRTWWGQTSHHLC